MLFEFKLSLSEIYFRYLKILSQYASYSKFCKSKWAEIKRNQSPLIRPSIGKRELLEDTENWCMEILFIEA